MGDLLVNYERYRPDVIRDYRLVRPFAWRKSLYLAGFDRQGRFIGDSHDKQYPNPRRTQRTCVADIHGDSGQDMALIHLKRFDRCGIEDCLDWLRYLYWLAIYYRLSDAATFSLFWCALPRGWRDWLADVRVESDCLLRESVKKLLSARPLMREREIDLDAREEYQREDDTVLQFAFTLEDLCLQEGVREEEQLQLFVGGVHPEINRFLMRRYKEHGIHSFPEAVSYARMIESAYQDEGERAAFEEQAAKKVKKVQKAASETQAVRKVEKAVGDQEVYVAQRLSEEQSLSVSQKLVKGLSRAQRGYAAQKQSEGHALPVEKSGICAESVAEKVVAVKVSGSFASAQESRVSPEEGAKVASEVSIVRECEGSVPPSSSEGQKSREGCVVAEGKYKEIIKEEGGKSEGKVSETGRKMIGEVDWVIGVESQSVGHQGVRDPSDRSDNSCVVNKKEEGENQPIRERVESANREEGLEELGEGVERQEGSGDSVSHSGQRIGDKQENKEEQLIATKISDDKQYVCLR